MNPTSELTTTLSRFAERCKGARWLGALFHVGVCQDIAADVVRHQGQIRDTTHAAETYDLEALAKIEDAQKPDSDGGTAITAKEMRGIKPLIVKSATLDHDASELAA